MATDLLPADLIYISTEQYISSTFPPFNNTTNLLQNMTSPNMTSPTGTYTTGTYPTSWVSFSSGIPHVILGANGDPLRVSSGADIFIGVMLVTCLLFGVPSNIMSLIYFAFKQKSEGLLLVLYVTISCTDICICMFHLPVTMLLFNGRKATLFTSIA